jgi:uncharacterized protein (TIGR01777 family)
LSDVILTGGTGFIGRPLCRRLIEQGFGVVCLTRNEAAAKGRGNGIKFVEWDGKSARGWKDYAEGASAIVNLAGESIGSGHWDKEKRQRILQSRIDAGMAVTEAVKSSENKPEVIIQASAIGIYGNRGHEILNESSDFGDGFLAEVAEKWEESTREVEALGVRRVVIRSGMVLGSSGGALPRLLLPYRFFVGGPIGSGKNWISWIHLTDEIECILFLLKHKDLNGVFNLTTPHPVQNKHFSRALGKQLKRPSFFAIPGLFLKLFLGKMAEETVLSSQRVFPLRLEEAGHKFAYPDLAAALANLLDGS